MSNPKVYADFHNLDDHNRLRLTCAGTQEDLSQLGLQLREGLVLTFYTDDADNAGNSDDLLIDGTVRFNEDEQCWVAQVDWQAMRHASDDASWETPQQAGASSANGKANPLTKRST